jgi:IS5 family transposase
MAGTTEKFRLTMRPEKRRMLPDTADGGLQELIGIAKGHIHAKVEHPFSGDKQKFDCQKTVLRAQTKKSCEIHVLTGFTNLFLDRSTFFATV